MAGQEQRSVMRARVLYLHPMTVKKLLRLKKEAEVDGAYRVLPDGSMRCC
jgi:hypothetical protein